MRGKIKDKGVGNSESQQGFVDVQASTYREAKKYSVIYRNSRNCHKPGAALLLPHESVSVQE
ncbi:MAG: hypothetical protein ACFB2X_27630 [Rivularia sp. (in: cyanobacteria)]